MRPIRSRERHMLTHNSLILAQCHSLEKSGRGTSFTAAMFSVSTLILAEVYKIDIVLISKSNKAGNGARDSVCIECSSLPVQCVCVGGGGRGQMIIVHQPGTSQSQPQLLQRTSTLSAN